MTMTDRKKPGVAFWATVVVVGLPLLYVLGIKPVCWLVRMETLNLSTVAHLYRPVVELHSKAPRIVERIVLWYAGTDEWGRSMLNQMEDSLRDEERFGRDVP
jgi:hypothetical protein